MRVRSTLLWAAAACMPAQLAAGPPACSCNGYINSAGQGECQTRYKGLRFCYVNKGTCSDERDGSSSSRVWSYKACAGYDSGPTKCHGLSGETCQFPFKYQGRTFTNCTTHDSANGAAWCATRVQGSAREAVISRLEDCSAPCDIGASPYEVCPRSPVVKGLSKGCCTRDRPCGVGEGDCDRDSDCRGGLKCGDGNCARFRPDNYHRADCCYDPYTRADLGKSQCLYMGQTYEHDETFPANDLCNDCHCSDGQVACTELKCTEGPQQCTTVGGADPGAKCAFPFIFDGVRYNECTVRAADDGKPWCSTRTDYYGNHISGQGHWGHCPSGGCSQGTCTWEAWGSWSSCSQTRATCDGGTQRRTRSGSGCSGSREEVIPCNQSDCTSVWGSWGAWGTCTVSCGQGVQRRTRRCQQGFCQGEDTESRGCSGQECGCRTGNRRVRRNVNKLTSRESRSLVAAMEGAISRGEYVRVGNFHGFPGNICGTASSPQSCCPHGETTFLPWHRQYMVQMEEVLGQALPYWDWTEDGQVPQLWEDVRAPIREGHQSLGGQGSQCPPGDVTAVRRAQGISINVESLQRATRTAFLKTTFEEFSDQISAPHNELHVSVNCDMRDITTAGYDPVFYLHHAYVDRQFAFWQELQRLRGLDSPRLARHSVALRPFDSRLFNDKQKTLENNLGSDTFDYRANYCYEYDDLTFMGMTPEEFLQENQQPSFSVPSQGQCPPDDEGVCLTESIPRQPAEVFVGVVLPKKAPSGIHTFQLCLGSRCIAAGQVATFGAGSSTSSQRVDSSTHMVVEYDVTDLVESSGWSGLELTARLTSSVVAELPGPVVIERFGGSSGGEVTLAPGDELADYGNLLEKYDIVSDMES